MNETLRFDLRRRRAEVLLNEAFARLRDLIPDENLREAHYRLLELFTEQGVEILTDHTRNEMGLPPRGPDGWTVDEMIALERRRLEELTRPLSFVVPAKDGGLVVDLTSKKA